MAISPPDVTERRHRPAGAPLKPLCRDPEQRVFSANDATPKWNNPLERQGLALKHKGRSGADIQIDVCATQSLFGIPAIRGRLAGYLANPDKC